MLLSRFRTPGTMTRIEEREYQRNINIDYDDDDDNKLMVNVNYRFSKGEIWKAGSNTIREMKIRYMSENKAASSHQVTGNKIYLRDVINLR